MATGPTTTTVRVKVATRDDVAAYGAEHDMSADEVIVAGLRALRWEQKRKRAEHEAAALSHNPEYLAEMRAVQEDLHAAG
ncbi:hypothetical protein SAMN06264364_13018 [Quadrisphaera granulorum]|uniref:CopG family transcriptional regulator n=1 Tax=Quadrisphaera granulorum TaxID=317664 RepID=A0A315ZUY3_9ACTN|nr:hypothetical protein [Quadrisphaera granulorum]PWJ48454.1 hypothetical protein BXY45_13018 [Quadrisphaera granulorum]SZE98413.1 hypothetical protein SAMN06264364_13018 [Quadrisphaera granulorum]